MTGWARCNLDGRPAHPADQAAVDRFRRWLALPDDRRAAPEWRDITGTGDEAGGTGEDDPYDAAETQALEEAGELP